MASHDKTPEEIFHEALAISDKTKRAEYLDQACQGDDPFRAQVEALIKSHQQAGSFLQGPATADPNATLDTPAPVKQSRTKIGRYDLLKKIGEGGMGLVYVAQQKHPVKRHVALKIIKPGMDSKQVVARFEAERQALALLDHAHIARVLDAGTARNGRPYFVMEYVKGLPITEYCDRKKLNIEDRLKLFIPICEAVQHAHQKGIIHRDLKPSNILVAQEGGKPIPKIIDFGVSKALSQSLTDRTLLTEQGQFIGTPEYMSPEQADPMSQDIDTRSDIYSLGVVLYELLAGALPFDSDSLRGGGLDAMRLLLTEQDPKTPSTRLTGLGDDATSIAQKRRMDVRALSRCLHRELEWIPMMAMRKDRNRRYRSALDLADDIRNYLRGAPLLAGPETVIYRIGKFARQHTGSVFTATFVALAVIVGLVTSTGLYLRTEKALHQEAVARSEAQAIADFLIEDVLASVYPERAKSPQVTVRYILDTASKHIEEKFKDKPLVEAMIRDAIGMTYRKLGKSIAETHLKRAFEIRHEQLGEEDPLTLTSMSHLGEIYSGRKPEAKELLSRAMELRTRVLGPEHPDTLESMGLLGMYHLYQANYQGRMKAESLFKKVTEIGTRVLGAEHETTLRAINGTAMIKFFLGQYEQAESLLVQGFVSANQVLGVENETTLWFMNLLGWIYTEQQRFDEAFEKVSLGFEVSERIVGEDHVMVAMFMNSLGYLYTHQKQFEEGIPLLIRSVEISQRILGFEHPINLVLTNRMATALQGVGQDDQFDSIMVQVLPHIQELATLNNVLASQLNHLVFQRITTLEDEGQTHFKAGQYEHAIKAFENLNILRRAQTGNATASALSYMAISLHRLDRLDEARATLSRLRKLFQDVTNCSKIHFLCEAEIILAGTNSRVCQIWGLIADNRLDVALEKLRAQQRQSTLNDPGMAESIQSIIVALSRLFHDDAMDAEQLGNYSKAIDCYQKALNIDPDYLSVRHELAWLLATCPKNRYRDGQLAVKHAMRICELAQWQEHQSLHTLAAAYATSGQYETAIHWQEKAIELLDSDMHPSVQSEYQVLWELYKSNMPYPKSSGPIPWEKFGDPGIKFIFGRPVNIGPVVNSPSNETDPFISSDGLALYFKSYRPGGIGSSDIWKTTRKSTNDPWGNPVNLGVPVNSPSYDIAPALSYDGLTLYFASNRPGGSGELDIWMVTRKSTHDPWEALTNLGPEVNTAAPESAPSISTDGLSLFFSGHPRGPFRPGDLGEGDLWVTTRKTKQVPWTTPINLGSLVNSSSFEGSPCVTKDGLSLLFNSKRSGNNGLRDLWITTRKTTRTPWSTPTNLGSGVNSTGADYNPSVSSDGSTLYFASFGSRSEGGPGNADIWQVSVKAVKTNEN